jgi:hypothetical protein
MSRGLSCDSERKTIDLGHQTEDRKRPEITQGEKSKSGIEREIPPLSEVNEG